MSEKMMNYLDLFDRALIVHNAKLALSTKVKDLKHSVSFTELLTVKGILHQEEKNQCDSDESTDSILVSMRIDSRCELTHSHPQWAAKCFAAYKNRVLKDGLEDEVHYVDRMVDDLLGDTDDPSQFESSSIEDGDNIPHKWKTASRDSLTSFVSAVTVDSILASSEIKNGENEDNVDSKERRGIESYIKMLDKVAKKSKHLREGNSISESISTSSSDCYSGQFDSCAPDDVSYSGSKDDTTIGTGQVFRTRVPYRRDTFVNLHSNDEVEADQVRTGFLGSQRRIKSFHGATSLSRRQDNSFTHSSEAQSYSFENRGDVPYAEQANRSIDHSGVFLDTFAKTNLKTSYDDGELKKNQFKVAATAPTSKEMLGKPSCVVSKGAVNGVPKKSTSSDEISVNIAFSDIYRDDSSTGSAPIQKSKGSDGFPVKSEFDDESTIASSSVELEDDGAIDKSSVPGTSKTNLEKKQNASNETSSKSFNSADKENNSGIQNALPAPQLLQPPYAKFAVSPTKQTKPTTETRLEKTKSFRQEVEKTIAAKEVTLFNLRMELDAKNKYFSATMRSADSTTKFIEQIIQQVNARNSDAALTELLLTDSADYSAFKVSDQSIEEIEKLESQLSALETALQREARPSLNSNAAGKGKNKPELLKALAATLRQRIASQKELLKMARYYKSVLQEKNKLLLDVTSKCKSLGNQVLTTSKLPPPKEVIA
eukprot:gene23634-32002_t